MNFYRVKIKICDLRFEFVVLKGFSHKCLVQFVYFYQVFAKKHYFGKRTYRKTVKGLNPGVISKVG